MKSLIKSVAAAFAAFTRLPAPNAPWTDETLRYLLAALPLVGLPIGLALWGWTCLCNALGFGNTLFAAGVTLLPLLLTGGVHMDGFCDTVDALSSRAEPAKKLLILKDPHPGAFAVLYTGVYLLGYFALAAELPRTPETALLLTLMHITSRAAGAFAALRFPLAGGDGMLAACRHAAAGKASIVAVSATFLLCAAGMACLSLYAGLGMALAAAICTLSVRRTAIREFSGMRGDLVGYLIQLCEITMLAALILIKGVSKL